MVPREALFEGQARAGPRLSPDGATLAFGVPKHPVAPLWVGPAGDVDAAKPVTLAGTGVVTRWMFGFAPGSFVYSLADEGKDTSRVYAYDFETRQSKDLTPPGKDVAHIEQLSPDRPHEVVIRARAKGAAISDLWLADLRTGAARLLYENTVGFVDFDVDADLRPRVATRLTPSGESELFALDDEGRERLLARIPLQDQLATRTLGVDARGAKLYLVDSRGRDTSALVSMDLESGATTVLAADERADVARVLTHPRTGAPEAVLTDPGKPTWRALDPSLMRDLGAIAGVEGSVEIVSRSLDDTRWLFRAHSPEQPAAYFLYDRTSREKRFLFHENPELSRHKLLPMDVVEVRARDGLPLVGYLTRPRSSAPGPAPMVLFVHGGPWDRDHWRLHTMHQLLGSRGYAVLGVNFRGSTGFGKKLLNAADREWGRAMQDDLVDAVRWAVAQGVADPTRVAIVGASYGGYAALMGMTRDAGTFACGVALAAPSDLVSFVESVPPYWRPLMGQIRARLGDLQRPEDRARLVDTSPITHAARVDRPVLIVQGALDPRVKESQSARMAEALARAGAPVTYLRYDGEGHGFSERANWVSFSAALEVFLSQCIGGVHQPIGDALAGSTVRAVVGGQHIAGLSAAALGGR